MNRRAIVTSAIVIAALGFAPALANAQFRRQEGGSRREGGGQSAARQERSQPRAERAPQGAPPRQQGSSRPSGSWQPSAPRQGGSYQPSAPRYEGGGSGQYQPRAVPRGSYDRVPPSYNGAGPSYDRGSSYRRPTDDRPFGSQPSYRAPSYRTPSYGYGRAVPRSDFYYNRAPQRSYGYSNGYRYSYSRPYYYDRPYVRPYGWAPYRPYYFSRPYYSFRPWVSLGFGLWIGDPVAYPWDYLGTYSPRIYGYYGGTYNVTPSRSVYGGVSFDIQPSDADVFVDGEYVGTVGTFTPYGEPLTLTAGIHRIAVQRDGYRSMEWEVTVEPGRVIPYRGEMERF